MVKKLVIQIFQVIETWRSEGFLSVLNELVFINKVAVTSVKDLSLLSNTKLSVKKIDVEFIEISKSNNNISRLIFPVKSRQLKAWRNLDKGYQGFAIAKGYEIIGDIWYVNYDTNSKLAFSHPDIKLLNINIKKNDVYMFDMYLNPKHRGGGLANFLMSYAHKELKKKGTAKVYGYYLADNFPALWVHRTLGYKELYKMKFQRFFWLQRSKKI